jgi:hypothetical protein
MLAISFFINRMVSTNIFDITLSEEARFNQKATQIKNILSSESCLGYAEEARISGQSFKTTSHKVLDKKKLDLFSTKYADVEPECATDPEYGYRVEIRSFGYSLSSYSNDATKETVHSEKTEEHWIFGQNVSSEGDAFEKEIVVSSPVTIFYSKSEFYPGLMMIKLTAGDMERLTSFIDYSCLNTESNKMEMYVHYPVEIKNINGNNYLCMKYISGEKCQRLSCQKEIEFSPIDSKGYYTFYLNSQVNKIKITR